MSKLKHANDCTRRAMPLTVYEVTCFSTSSTTQPNNACTARERHLHCSRATLAPLASHTCVAQRHCLLHYLATFVTPSDIACHSLRHCFLFPPTNVDVYTRKVSLQRCKIVLSNNHNRHPTRQSERVHTYKSSET